MSINKSKQLDFSSKEESILKKIQIKWKSPGWFNWYDLAIQDFLSMDSHIEKFALSFITKLKVKDACSFYLDGKLWDSIAIRNSLFYKMSENYMFSEEYNSLYKSLYLYLFWLEPKFLWKQVSVMVHKDELNNIYGLAWSRIGIEFATIEKINLDSIDSKELVTKRVIEDVKKTVEDIVEVKTKKKITRKTITKPINTRESGSISKIDFILEPKIKIIEWFKNKDDVLEFYRNEFADFLKIENILYFTSLLKAFIKFDLPSKDALIIKKSILRLKPSHKFYKAELEYFNEVGNNDTVIEKEEKIVEENKEEAIDEPVVDFDEIKWVVDKIEENKEDEKPKTSVKYKGALEKKLDIIKLYTTEDEFIKFYKKERPNFSSKKNVEYFVAILDKFIELKYTWKFFDTIKWRILKLENDYDFSDKQKDYFKLLESWEDIETSLDEEVVNFDEIKQAVEVIEKREEVNVEVKESNEISVNSTEELEKSSIDDLINKILQISSDEEIIAVIKNIKDLSINDLNNLFDEIAKDFSKYNEVVIKYLLDKKWQQKDTRSIQKIITYLDSINSNYSWWIEKYKEVLWDSLLIIGWKNSTEVKEVTKEVVKEVEVIKEVQVEVVKEVEKIVRVDQSEELEKDIMLEIDFTNSNEELKEYFNKINYFSSNIVSSYIAKLSEFWAYKDIYNINKMFSSKISEDLYKKCLLDSLDIAPNSKNKLKFMLKKLWVK